ncbi:hypothetical protein DPM13_19350 [Paracoccus mutanolyticus]|uniref:Uncharacterized protein n=2 Tax=Paracoccus mutanolyticus TaxID=1499308 RepID=A0ABM6WUK6_9RHOB|nr:hypothetical protein DPM13_19350 [Paracoccus mutanolyticus]
MDIDYFFAQVSVMDRSGRFQADAAAIPSGDAPESDGRRQLLCAIEQLSHALNDKDSHLALSYATAFVLQTNYYHALKQLRTLLPREARIMASSHHDI